MNWTETLRSEVEDTYKATEALLDKVDPGSLDWKPSAGDNWMTTGQLLKHITTACGFCFRGFVTGEWPMPEGAGDPADMKPEDMLPPAEALPTSASVDEAKQELAADKELAFAMLAEAGEDKLANQDAVAPWDPRPMKLGRRLLHMVGHLGNHKAQLFYYLKLQGKKVNTWDLYGG